MLLWQSAIAGEKGDSDTYCDTFASPPQDHSELPHLTKKKPSARLSIVSDKPFCVATQRKVYGATLGEPVAIREGRKASSFTLRSALAECNGK